MGFSLEGAAFGELSISAYALVRYFNQLPATQTFVDHLGNEHEVDTRNDIYLAPRHGLPEGMDRPSEARLPILLLDGEHDRPECDLRQSRLPVLPEVQPVRGHQRPPGTRSLQGSHPYWLGNDRVMADEFFRPVLHLRRLGQGEPVPGLWYNAMVGNNSSALGITATQLDRSMSTGGSVWWMPTTTEFGPQGGFGDWEYARQARHPFRRLQRRAAPRNASPTSITRRYRQHHDATRGQPQRVRHRDRSHPA